jgi:SAM-dependent methyltransferase
MEEFVDFYEHMPDEVSEVVQRHLPPPPCDVLDVGGAAGVYSAWLGSLGYRTHLIDAVPRHVRQARQDARISVAELVDARQLARPDDSVDAVLLMGPLYHLTERADRLQALAEARRVLHPGGFLFAAAISRFASLLDSLARGFIDDPRFVAILEEDLRTGQHRNTTGEPDYFTTAFFHHPDEFKAEVAGAGFTLTDLVAVEGPGWLAPGFDERWADPARRKQLLDLVRLVEHEPSLIGFSPHLLAVAKKGT